MKKKINVKSNKAITLIALVITIVILIILAAIAINLSLDKNGIFNRTKQAKEQYEKATIKEKISIAITDIQAETIAKDEQFTIDTIISELPNKIENTTIEKDIEGAKGISNNYNYKIDDKYNIIIEGLIESTKGDSEEKNEPVLLASVVNVGDYVAYDPTAGVTDISKLSYNSPKGTGTSHGNGYNDQTISANNILKWRVFSKNDKTGEVVLINNNSITLQLKGAIGWLYGEQEIASACSIFGYGLGADTSKEFYYVRGFDKDTDEREIIRGSGSRSITFDDIYKIIMGNNSIVDILDQFNIKTVYPTMNNEKGISSTAKEIICTNKTYYYDISEYIDIESEQYKNLNSYSTQDELKNGYNFLLLNRNYKKYTSVSINYSIASVRNGNVGAEDCNLLLTHTTSGAEEYLGTIKGIRPIVYLKHTIKTEGKNEKGEWTIIDK